MSSHNDTDVGRRENLGTLSQNRLKQDMQEMYLQILWNPLKSIEILWNPLKIHWNPLESYEHQWNPLKSVMKSLTPSVWASHWGYSPFRCIMAKILCPWEGRKTHVLTWAKFLQHANVCREHKCHSITRALQIATLTKIMAKEQDNRGLVKRQVAASKTIRKS